jgi:hypothetical protein
MITFRKAKIWLAISAACAFLCCGVVQAQSAVPESQLETFLGLSQGDLFSLNNGQPMNGSAIMQSITVGTGGGHACLQLRFPDQLPVAGQQPARRIESVCVYDSAVAHRFR